MQRAFLWILFFLFIVHVSLTLEVQGRDVFLAISPRDIFACRSIWEHLFSFTILRPQLSPELLIIETC
jgi:hypothetical protein